MSCKIYGNFYPEQYLSVSECPPNADRSTEIFCKAYMPGMLTELIPVVGPGGVIYHNIYCALCNGVSIKELSFPTLNATCPFVIDAKLGDINILVDTFGCDSIFQMADPLKFRTDTFDRKCSKRIRSCEDENPYYKGCMSSLHSPVTKGRLSFSNVYCAMCFGYKNTSIECSDKATFNGDRSSERTQYSMTLIFRNGNNRDQKMNPGECPDNYFYNKLTNSCHNFMCGFGHTLVNGTCLVDPYDSAYFMPNTTKYGIFGSLSLYLKRSSHLFFANDSEQIGKQFAQLVTLLLSLNGSVPNITSFHDTKLGAHNKMYLYSLPDKSGYFLLERGRYNITFFSEMDMREAFGILKQMKGTLDRLTFPILQQLKVQFELSNIHPADLESCTGGQLKVVQLQGKQLFPPVNSPTRSDYFALKFQYSYSDDSNNATAYLCDGISRRFAGCQLTKYNISEVQINEDNSLKIGGTNYLRNEFYVDDSAAYICIKKLTRDFLTGDVTGQQYFSTIAMAASIIALFITIMTYLLFRPLRTVPGKMVLCLCTFLGLAHLVFMTLTGMTDPPILCVIVAMLQHFLWLSVFCWMNSLAIDTAHTFWWGTVISAMANRKKISGYIIYSIIVPVVFVGISAVFHFTQIVEGPVYGGQVSCWILNSTVFTFTFIGPLGFVCSFNIVLFLLTLYGIIYARKQTKAVNKNTSKLDILLYLKLCLVLGLTWIFGIMYYFSGDTVSAYLFLAFNATNGVLISTAFMLNPRVLRLYQRKLRSLRGKDTTTTSMSTSQQVLSAD
ncbi:uncharacterized protein LOC141901165 [Tubulanus polymorphus]|uniref:uncharacterized protein LOC141901165 n=1 Tax=Tubulanus polymorphus TaxID=672921 RepID=UPI003DA6AFC8